MGNPVAELRKVVFTREREDTGRVVSVGASTVSVKTSKGTRTFPVAGGLQFQVGEPIRLVNGVAVGVTADESTVPTYYV